MLLSADTSQAQRRGREGRFGLASLSGSLRLLEINPAALWLAKNGAVAAPVRQQLCSFTNTELLQRQQELPFAVRLTGVVLAIGAEVKADLRALDLGIAPEADRSLIARGV